MPTCLKSTEVKSLLMGDYEDEGIGRGSKSRGFGNVLSKM